MGGSSAKRNNAAWRQVYRALNHAAAKDACLRQGVISQFPRQIQNFASLFVTMQIERHAADYDPDGIYFKSAVLNDIRASCAAMRDFIAAPATDRRAFAAWVLFRLRK